MRRGKSLQLRLTSVLLATVLIIFGFGVMIYAVYERRNRGLLYNALYESIVVYERSIEREIRSVERLSIDVMSDEIIQEHLIGLQNAVGFERQQLADQLSRRFAMHTRLPYVQAIVAMDRTGRFTASRSDFPQMDRVLDPVVLDEFRRSQAASRWIITDSPDRRLFYLRRVREIADFRLADLGTVIIVVEKQQLAASAVSTPFSDAMQVAVVSGGRSVYSDGPAAGQVIGAMDPRRPSSGYRVMHADAGLYFSAGVEDPERGLTVS